MKVLELIDELEKLIESGNTLPFSSKSLIAPEDALEIIDEIKQEIPKEVQEAQDIVSQKNQILLEAQNEADTIIKEAERQFKQLINENEITKKATLEAEEILENAQNTAKEIRVGTHHYTDRILYNLQVQLRDLNDAIEANRNELKIINVK